MPGIDMMSEKGLGLVVPAVTLNIVTLDTPSEMPEAVAAVTVPPFLKTVGSLAMISSVVSGRGYSSTRKSSGPLRPC